MDKIQNNKAKQNQTTETDKPEQQVHLTNEEAVYFRNLLKGARAEVLKNTEAFDELLFVFERFGKFLYNRTLNTKIKNKKINTAPGFGPYKDYLFPIAKKSPLAEHIPGKYTFHVSFTNLYEIIRIARNSALHEGAFARHLSVRSVELALILEDALMKQINLISEFMVKNPVQAYIWQPISLIRQTMLANSFSYIPVLHNNEWKLIQDFNLVKYLNYDDNIDLRIEKPLNDAINENKGLELLQPQLFSQNKKISEVLDHWDGLPILITNPQTNDLIGILTPYDLL